MMEIDVYKNIIDTIWSQYDDIANRLGVCPNKVILGSMVVDFLKHESGVVCYNYHDDNSSDSFVLGLPIVTDRKNIYTIEVCYAPKKCNIKSDIDALFKQLRQKD